MGDFNIDLIKYASENYTGEFYDLLCSHSFRPLILQPTRVTSKSATLIDNIFINDISCSSLGGNVTSSISDHFFQFCQTDIFETTVHTKKVKYVRDFRHFNKPMEQMRVILDCMAPYRKMSQKQIRLEQPPWITLGLLVSMKKRDKLSKQRAREKDSETKNEISGKYKLHRNMILLILRRVTKNYDSAFFLQNQGNIKKNLGWY